MATRVEKPKYTHYNLNETSDNEKAACIYSCNQTQRRLCPTNIVQCLQLDHVTSTPGYKQHYVQNGLAQAKCLYSQNVYGHMGCVNAINFSNGDEELLVSGGDDVKVLLWRVSELIRGKYKAIPMEAVHTSNIFTATFSCDNAYIYSGGNDANLIKHDTRTGKQVSVHPHSEAVYSISAHPHSSDTIITASEDGVVRIIDTRLPHFSDDMSLVEDRDAFQCVTFNPVEPCLVATGNTQFGSALYDTRIGKRLFRYTSSKYTVYAEDVVSVSFSRNGKYLYTMQRKRPPCLYRTTQRRAIAIFMDENGDYMNTVSMKSGCFMGTEDEYVASGSDDFRVYIWKIPDDLEREKGGIWGEIDNGVVPSPHLVLPGHRSIANQIRYSSTHHLLCSSGVEKIIKLWSHVPLSQAATLQYSGGPPSRKRYTRREFLQFSVGSDNEDENEEGLNISAPEQEDRGVLAFFDALVNEEESRSSDLSTTPEYVVEDCYSSDDSPPLPRRAGQNPCPFNFMQYPYPDEERGRATWYVTTPHERWDRHHGIREWYYGDDDEGDEEGAWSDEEEDREERLRERENSPIASGGTTNDRGKQEVVNEADGERVGTDRQPSGNNNRSQKEDHDFTARSKNHSEKSEPKSHDECGSANKLDLLLPHTQETENHSKLTATSSCSINNIATQSSPDRRETPLQEVDTHKQFPPRKFYSSSWKNLPSKVTPPLQHHISLSSALDGVTTNVLGDSDVKKVFLQGGTGTGPSTSLNGDETVSKGTVDSNVEQADSSMSRAKRREKRLCSQGTVMNGPSDPNQDLASISAATDTAACISGVSGNQLMVCNKKDKSTSWKGKRPNKELHY